MLDRNDQRYLSPQRAGLPVDPNGNSEYRFDGYGFRNGQTDAEEAFNPLKLLWYVIQYRWLIVALVIVGLVLGLVTTLMQTPKYSASARIEIMVPTARILEDMDVVAQSGDMRQFETTREKLKSRDLARRVVQQLNLSQNASFLFPRPDFSISNIFARVLGSAPVPNIASVDAERREAIAVGAVLSNLSITLIRGTSLLSVSYSDPSPQMASDIVNQVVRSYMDQQVDRTIETSDLARQFIQEQVAQVKTRLEASESELVAYAKQAGITSAGQDGSLVAANITALNTALSTAIQDRLSDERIVKQIDAGEGASLQQVIESESIQSTRSRLAGLRADYQQKLGTFQPAFPEMVNLSAQIAELERQVGQEIGVIGLAIKLRYQQSIQAETDLRTELAQLQGEQVEFQDKNIKYTILNREVESNRAQYQSLIDKLNELGVVSDLRRANIDVVDYSLAPGSPYAPSLFRNLLMFAGIAAALAAAIIYVLELLNNKFNVPDQIEAELHLPVLGIIPKVDAAGSVADALADSRSPLSEAYRSLRTSLQFAGSNGTPKSLLITSSEPGESKSTSSFKLAAEFAAIGMKVLLIDGDLRRPTLHRTFKTDNSLGLSNLLTGTISHEEIEGAFRSTDTENLTFLSTGPMVPNPADLLSSPRMAQILSVCSKKYDFILIDGPPVIGLSDALILSRLAETTVLVVAAHQTSRKSAKAALKRLRSAGGHIVGAMLGKLDIDKIEYNYSYRYMSEGYYAYGSDPEKLADGPSTDGQTKIGTKADRGMVGLYNSRIRPLFKRNKPMA